MILLGTGNPKKATEMRNILMPLGVRGVIAVALPDVEEDGATFQENARKKALAFAAHCSGPVLADDSGLVVPALSGEPGVRSARYAGEDAGDEANLELLLKRIDEAGLGEPDAYFACCCCLALPDRVLIETEGRVAGRIVATRRGAAGFGYDPIFFHPGSGCTFAELEPEAKNALSHRALALAAFAKLVPEHRDVL